MFVLTQSGKLYNTSLAHKIYVDEIDGKCRVIAMNGGIETLYQGDKLTCKTMFDNLCRCIANGGKFFDFGKDNFSAEGLAI